uniref:spondin-2-like n=1 Tax=Myxine glutinosa TaxID=7769 RepID=UPI00358E1EEB
MEVVCAMSVRGRIEHGLLVWTVLVLLGPPRAATSGSNSSRCGKETVRYSVTFHATWNQLSFPKQYPRYRPPAQWSPFFGCVHSANFSLWTKGSVASPALRAFAEEGEYEALQTMVETGIKTGLASDWFLGPAIPSGLGTSSATFKVTAQYSQVSALVRLVPSPDWFVGVESMDLRSPEDHRWVAQLQQDLLPWDAGTDSGFTFSSPNFASNPPESVSRITAQKPSHPASSFYYPRLKSLPRIGYLEFNFVPGIPESWSTGMENSSANTFGQTVEFGLNRVRLDEKNTLQRETKWLDEGDEVFNIITTSLDQEDNTTHVFKRPAEDQGTPLDCEVSPWSPWGFCSQSCGVGVKRSTRYIILDPANDGLLCPPLHMESSCTKGSCAMDIQDEVQGSSTQGLLRSQAGLHSPTSTSSPQVTESGDVDARLTNSAEPRVTESQSHREVTALSRQTTESKHLRVAHPGEDLRTMTVKGVTTKPSITHVPFDHGLPSEFPVEDQQSVSPRRSTLQMQTLALGDPNEDAVPDEMYVIRPPKTRGRLSKLKKVNCEMSRPTSSGPCSRTCGFGLRSVKRVVLRHARNGGRPCPTLQLQEVCLLAVCPTSSSMERSEIIHISRPLI